MAMELSTFVELLVPLSPVILLRINARETVHGNSCRHDGGIYVAFSGLLLVLFTTWRAFRFSPLNISLPSINDGSMNFANQVLSNLLVLKRYKTKTA